MINKVYLCNCMYFMKDKPDKYYDLAIVDPPYGIIDYIILGGETNCKIKQRTELKKWDKQPPPEYWKQLFRISNNQIIYGANYFTKYLPFSRGWIFWDKLIPRKFDRAKGEFIFTSFNRNAAIIKMLWNGNKLIGQSKGKENKFHSTQKPVALGLWLLQNYAKPGWKILDTHVGSGYMRKACHQLGFDFEGCEIDPDYWLAQEEDYRKFKDKYALIDEALEIETCDNSLLV